MSTARNSFEFFNLRESPQFHRKEINLRRLVVIRKPVLWVNSLKLVINKTNKTRVSIISKSLRLEILNLRHVSDDKDGASISGDFSPFVYTTFLRKVLHVSLSLKWDI